MGIFALGTGFVNAANQRIEENRNESRENRKLAMEVWMKDTRPKILAARAKDEAYVSTMNTLMQDSTFKGQPARAFYAAKWMSTTGKDITEFNNFYAQGNIPEELKAEQMAEMQKHFNFDDKTNSFSWKDRAPAVSQAQPQMGGGQKPSFWNKLMGTPDAGKDMNKGVSDMAKAVGEDPNASTEARFDKINVPGSFTPIDQKAEKLKQLGLEAATRNLDLIRNQQGFLSDLVSGNREAIEARMKDPKFTITRDEQDKKETTKEFRTFILRGIASGEMKHEALSAIALNDPNKLLGAIQKNLKTDEEKAEAALKLKMIEQVAGGLDNPQAFSLLNSLGLMDKLPITPENLKKGEARAKELLERDLSIQDQIWREAFNKTRKPEEQVAPRAEPGTLSAPASPAPGAEAPPAKVEKTVAQEIEDVMNSDEGLILKAKDPQKQGTEIKAPNREEEISAIAEKGTPDQIRASRNPVGLLRAVTARTKGGKEESFARMAEVASNITITPEVAARIMENEDYGNEWNKLMSQYVEPYLQEFGSMEDARAVVHPFGLAKVNGNIVVVNPKKGN